MSKIFVLSAISKKNFHIKNTKKCIILKFCGVYCGESFRDIILEIVDDIELYEERMPCILEIMISALEKNRITGKLVSIKILEEFQ